MTVSHGAGGTRTHDLRFRKPLLYPTELQPQEMFFGLISTMLNESRRGNRKNVLFCFENKPF